MSPRTARCLVAAAILAMTTACSFHSVASHWNGRVGPDGYPVYVRRVTNVGINVLVMVPVFGNTSIDEMIEESTFEIAEKDSDHVRVIESSAENYWHGFPPFTWFITPVITEVSVEYRPSEREIAEMTEGGETADEGAQQGGGPGDADIPPSPDR